MLSQTTSWKEDFWPSSTAHKATCQEDMAAPLAGARELNGSSRYTWTSDRGGHCLGLDFGGNGGSSSNLTEEKHPVFSLKGKQSALVAGSI